MPFELKAEFPSGGDSIRHIAKSVNKDISRHDKEGRRFRNAFATDGGGEHRVDGRLEK
jgi:hypothetical protein